MKKFLIVIIFSLIAFAANSSVTSSQVMKNGFVVQNTHDTSQSNVAIKFYNLDGSIEHMINLTIEPYSSSLIDPDDLEELTQGWSGSAIITSTATAIIGAGWTETFSKYGKPEGAGWYNLPDSSDRVYLPLVQKDSATGFETNLWAQNVSTSNTATVIVTYYPHGEGTPLNSTCPNFAPGTSLNLNNSCLPNLPDSFVGTAIVSTDQQVAVLAKQSNPARKTECLFNGISGFRGDNELFFPIVQNNYQGWHSSFSLQNMGASTYNGDFDYHADCGNTCGWEGPWSSPSIGPGYGYVFTPTTDSFSGYGKFISDQVLSPPFGSVAWVQNNLAKVDYCYNGYDGGTTYLVPEENIWFLPTLYSDSVIVIKNTNETTGGEINFNWSGVAGQQNVVLGANDKKVITPTVPDGWAGSGVAELSSGLLPIAIVIQNPQPRGKDRGAYYAYGKDMGATQLYVPLVRKAEKFQPTIWKIYNPAILNGIRGEE